LGGRRDIMIIKPIPQNTKRPKRDFVDIDGLLSRIVAAEQGANIVEYLAGTTAFADDRGQIRSHLFEVERLTLQESQGRIASRGDRRQGLPYLVRNRCRHRF